MGTPLRAPGKGRVLAWLGWAGENVTLMGATRKLLEDQEGQVSEKEPALFVFGEGSGRQNLVAVLLDPFKGKSS